MVADADLSILPRRALLFGDRYLETASSGVNTHVYAATGKPTGDVPLAGASEIDAAVAAARRALPSWSGMPRNARRDILIRLARLLQANAEELARLSTIDNGIVVRTQQYGPHAAAGSFLYNVWIGLE